MCLIFVIDPVGQRESADIWHLCQSAKYEAEMESDMLGQLFTKLRFLYLLTQYFIHDTQHVTDKMSHS